MEQAQAPPPTTPYRTQAEIPPLRSWAVRSSVFTRVRRLVLGLLVISIPLLFLLLLSTLRAGPVFWVGPEVAILALFMVLSTRAGHEAGRVAGGRGQIHLYDHRLEVPPSHSFGRANSIVLPLDGLEMQITHHQVSINFVITTEETRVELRAGAVARVLSSRLFRDAQEFERFVAVVERARRRRP